MSRQPAIVPGKIFDRDPEKNRPIARLERQTRRAVTELGANKLDPQSVAGVVRTGIHRAKSGEFVRCSPNNSDGVTVLLPTPSVALQGRSITVKKVKSGTDPVVVGVVDSSTIDGATQVTEATAFSVSVYACDGAAWWRVV